MLQAVLKVVLYLILIFLAFCFAYAILKTLSILVKNRTKRKHSLKRKWLHKLWHLRDTRYIKIVEFAKWVMIDIFRGKDSLRLFGIWAFTGYYGEGKTMGCVQFAHHLKRSYPHRNIHIFSNIDVKGQDKKITSWEELLDLPKNSIMIYDESQSDWSCNMGVNAFPEDFLRRITQVRKKQFALFMTSPRYNRMNINIRESCNFVIECKNLFQLDRWFKYVFYRAEDYEQYNESKIKLMANKYLTMSIVVQDKDYKLYDTKEEVKTIKTEDAKATKKDQVMISDLFKNFRNEIIKEIDLKLKKIS